MAEHPIHRVTAFSIVGPHRLAITFADGVTRTIDFLPVLRGELLGPLRDLAFFESVVVDDQAGTLVWPNGADFDPATLHDWPAVARALAARAKAWTR